MTSLHVTPQDATTRLAGRQVLLCSNEEPFFYKELSTISRLDEFRIDTFREQASLLSVGHDTPGLLLSYSSTGDDSVQQHRIASRLAATLAIEWVLATNIEEHLLLVASPLSACDTPCYACILACAYAQCEAKRPRAARHELPQTVRAALTAGLIGDILTEYLGSKPGVGSFGLAGVKLYHLQDFSSESVLVGRVPGCPVCWPDRDLGNQVPEYRVSAPPLFEECSRTKLTGSGLKESLLPKRSRSGSSAAPPRDYPNSHRVALTTEECLSRKSSSRQGQFGKQELSDLLFMTFGRWTKTDNQRTDRLLPSSGNIGSAGTFVVVSCVPGVEPGIYFYLEASHELVRLDCLATGTVADILKGFDTGRSSRLPGALFILIGQVGRLAYKYGAFAYRLTHFDSGLSQAHLSTVARALSLTIHTVDRWPDRMLTERLSCDPNAALITAVIGFSAFDPRDALSSREWSVWQVHSKRNIRNNLYQPVSSPLALARTIQKTSCECLDDDWSDIHVVNKSILTHEGDLGRQPLIYPRTEIWNRLILRKSVRAFNEQHVSTAIMALILSRVTASVATSSQPRIKVLATRRSGSGPQVSWSTYQHASRTAVSLHNRVTATGTLDHLFVKPVRAPLLFWFCGNVAQDPWSYRQTLLAAGEQGYLLMQEALSFGLEGYLIGGIWPQRIAQTLGLHSYWQSPLLAFACGWHENVSGEQTHGAP